MVRVLFFLAVYLEVDANLPLKRGIRHRFPVGKLLDNLAVYLHIYVNKAALKKTVVSLLQIAETVMWENIFQLVRVS